MIIKARRLDRVEKGAKGGMGRVGTWWREREEEEKGGFLLLFTIGKSRGKRGALQINRAKEVYRDGESGAQGERLENARERTGE